MVDERRNIAALDALRGVAAFLVVLGHSRATVLGAQGLPASGVGWQKIALLPTSYAEEAVAVFFVLSGYLVGGQVLRSLRRGDFSWRGYIARRVSRLYVVLVPAVLATLVVDAVARSAFPGEAPLVGVVGDGPKVALCNLVFLQESRCDPVGSNNALWSLSYEFWFYILFAACAAALFMLIARRYVLATGNLIVAGACLTIFGVHLLWLIPAWLMGVALAEWQQWRPQNRTATRSVLLSACLLGVVATASTIVDGPRQLSFVVVGASSLALVHVMTCESGIWASIPVRQTARLGAWSYTLYAFHRPVVGLIAAALAATLALSGVVAVCVVYLMAAVVTVVVFPAYYLGERHTLKVRQFLLAGRSNAAVVRSA